MSSPKRILIVVPSFRIGGTIVSLYSFLSVLDPSRLIVDVMPVNSVGVYKQMLPNCNIVHGNVWMFVESGKTGFFHKITFLCFRSITAALRRIGLNIDRYCIKFGGMKFGTYRYDAVVSFQEGNYTRLVSALPAKKRIAWIRCDYNRHRAESGYTNEFDVYKHYDKIICVTNYVKSQFDGLYPLLSSRCIGLHNIINVDNIRKMSLDVSNIDERFDTSLYTILSVGRLDPVKQFDKIPKIATELKTLSDKKFKWFIIGGGNNDLSAVIQKEIDKYNIGDSVVLLGEKANIYPYLANADLYVCTSYSESYPRTVNESRALGIPVVSNSFPTIHESIRDGIDGFVTNMDEMPKTINEVMRKSFTISNIQNDDQFIIEEMYKLFNA